MNKVTICENALDPRQWETLDCGDVREFLKNRFPQWPATARIYLDYVAESADVTPHDEATVERLGKLEGHFYVIIYPEDFITVMVIIAVAVSAIAIGLAFLLRPSPNLKNQQQQSPNNSLSDRQNRERPNQRIPDIYGTLWATPDLIAVPYRLFENNDEVEYCYMCLGRGHYDVAKIRDDTTDVEQIDGISVEVYGPNTSPNSGDEPTLRIGKPINTRVYNVKRSNAINGQILRAPNASTLKGNWNINFVYPDAIGTNAEIDFTDFFAAGDTLMIQDSLAKDPAKIIHSVSVDGTYQILDVSPKEIVLVTPSAVNGNWNRIQSFATQMSEYGSPTLSTTADRWVGPYIVDDPNVSEIWCNFVCPQGSYQLDKEGNQSAVNILIQLAVQAIDAVGNPIGAEVTYMGYIQGSSQLRNQRAVTVKALLPLPGPCQVRARRYSNTNLEDGYQVVDQTQWRDLYAVSPVLQQHFGNVTTVQAVTRPTQDAMTVKERKLNMLIGRRIHDRVHRYDNIANLADNFDGGLSANWVTPAGGFFDHTLQIVGGKVQCDTWRGWKTGAYYNVPLNDKQHFEIEWPASEADNGYPNYNGYRGAIGCCSADAKNFLFVAIDNSVSSEIKFGQCINNVMTTYSGDYPMAALGDKIGGRVIDNQFWRTKNGVPVGTPHTIAPEVLAVLGNFAGVIGLDGLGNTDKANMDNWSAGNVEANEQDFSTYLYSSNNAADIIVDMALDPYIGNRTLSELDVEGIYAAIDAVKEYFGTDLCTQFCYTFDDSKVSFEEMVSDVATAVFCTAYRRGSVLSLFFEKLTENSVLLFNHRNKIPRSETRTITFGTVNAHDGIELDYIDPNAPNAPDIDTTCTLYFPADQSATNPKKITTVGIRNNVQAHLLGSRIYNKMKYQNTSVQFDGTQEAAELINQQRILVADNTRPDTQDGEVVAQNGLELTLSQPVEFVAGRNYTIFLQLYDATVQSIAITPGSASDKVVLALAPAKPLVVDLAMYARTTYMIVDDTPQRSAAFLLQEKSPKDGAVYELKAINYDDRYYANDTDFKNNIVQLNSHGGGTNGGYTAGNTFTTLIDGKTMPWRSDLNPSYAYGRNDGSAPVVIPLTGSVVSIAAAPMYQYSYGGISLGLNAVRAYKLFPWVDANGGTSNPQIETYGQIPSYYMGGQFAVGHCGLVGAFCKKDGTVIAPIAIGMNGSFNVPEGAEVLQLGINDNMFNDNEGYFTVSVQQAGTVPDPITPPVVEPPQQSAHELWVAATGDDLNDGTQAHPYKTLEKADSVVLPNSTVYVLPGTYTVSPTLELNASGDGTGKIVWFSTVKGGAKIVSDGAASDYDRAVWIRGNYVEFNGFDVSATNTTVLNDAVEIAGNNCKVTNCIVHDIPAPGPVGKGGSGICSTDWTGVGNNEISNNFVYNIGDWLNPTSNPRVHGIYPSNYGCKVLNNVVWHCASWGIHFGHAADACHCINNTVFSNGYGGICISVSKADNENVLADNFIVANNIVFHNGIGTNPAGYGIEEYNSAANLGPNCKYYNNLVYDNLPANWNLQVTGGTGVSTVTANPGFANWQADGSGDYHLASTSPARDKGNVSYASATDIEGVTRTGQGSAPDIGAYEYTSTATDPNDITYIITANGQ